jgi:heat shock protein HspQ
MTLEMKFMIGQVVHHRLFDYRGVIVEAHPTFHHTDEWYRKVARTRPSKDKPWYRVLVHRTPDVTYVAERNLEEDRSGEPIAHPLLQPFFDSFQDGYYSRGPRVS